MNLQRLAAFAEKLVVCTKYVRFVTPPVMVLHRYTENVKVVLH